MSGVDSTPLDSFSSKTTRDIEDAEERRVTHTMQVKAEKNLTDAQREAIRQREQKQREEDERKKAAADKLERKRREAEERIAAQRSAAGSAAAAGAEPTASADRLAAAADLLKMAVDAKLKSAAGHQKASESD
jgi:sRNA-binding protein